MNIKIDSCQIDDKGAILLANNTKYIRNIEIIRLSNYILYIYIYIGNNNICDESAKVLIQNIRIYNPKVRELILCNNNNITCNRWK